MRSVFRKPSFSKILGAYRSQWLRTLMRLFFPFSYGRKGSGWFTNPNRAAYNWWYHRTSIDIRSFFGGRKHYSKGANIFAMLVFGAISLIALPVDIARAGVKSSNVKKEFKYYCQKNGLDPCGNPKSKSDSSSSSSSRSSTASSTKSNHTEAKTNNKSSDSLHDNTVRLSSKENANSTLHQSSLKATEKTSVTKEPQNTALQKQPQINKEEIAKKELSDKPKSSNEIKIKPYESESIVAHEFDQQPKNDTAPKYAPKHEKDQSIKKHFIENTLLGDADAIASMKIGDYLELKPSPVADDKDAIALLSGEKIVGYVPVKDRLPYLLCFKLQRSLYAVITDIVEDDCKKLYEFETWYESKKHG